MTPLGISPRILIVDDQPANRELLARLLQACGYCTDAAEDGEAALEMLRAATFDLVLLDILMPRLDGHSTLGIMKADPDLRHVPVIVISAVDELQSTVRCIEAGAEDYVPKPFNAVFLRARISACLEKKRLRDQERRALETETELLERTLAGAVQLLGDLLALTAPAAARRAALARRRVEHAVQSLGWEDPWIYRLAAQLSQIGAITLAGSPGPGDGREEQLQAACVAQRLLANIPRLETVAEIVRWQAEPPPAGAPLAVARGAALLRAALEPEPERETPGAAPALADHPRLAPVPAARQEWVPDDISRSLEAFHPGRGSGVIAVTSLQSGDILEDDVLGSSGVLLLTRGTEINAVALERLARFATKNTLRVPFRVRRPGQVS